MAQSGYTPILIYASGTAAAVPSAANLTSSANGAELALNYADGKLYYKNSSGVVTLLAQAGGNPPGGSNTYVQYNNAGAFGGSANFVWDNSNVRLGIGTSSPATKLDVRGTPGADYGIANIFDTTSAASGVGGVLALSGYKTTTSGSAIFAKIKGIKENATAGNEAGALTFETNSGSAYTERMRIDSSGNVGIGTSSPIARLTVSDSTAKNGTMTLGNDGSYYGGLQYTFSTGELRISQVGGASLGTTFYTSGSERMRITSAGNVGIGTSSPTTKLDIGGPNTGSALADGVRVSTSIGFGASWGDGLSFYNSNPSYLAQLAGIYPYTSGSSQKAGNLIFATNDSTTYAERMRITSAGKVGIGTTSPAAGLDIVSAGQTTAALNTSGDLNLVVSDTGASAGNGGSIVFGYNSGSGKFAAIKGLVTTGAGNSIGNLAFSVRTNTGDSTLTEAMRINSSGALLIGDTSASGSRLYTYGTANDNNVYFYRNTGATAPTTYPVVIRGQSGGSNSASYGVLQILGLNGLGNSSSVQLGCGMPGTYTYHDTGFLQLYGGGLWQNQEYHWSTDGTTTYQGIAYQGCEFYNHRSDSQVAFTFYAASTGQSASVVYSRCARTTTNSTYNLFFGTNGNGTGQFAVRDSGNCVNTNNSYGSISDVKLKQDIVDASNQWDDIKNLRIRKFRWKTEVAENPNAKPYLGLIAQEAELVSPGLIEETADYDEFEEDSLDENGNVSLKEDGTPHKVRNRRALGTTTKSIKYSILYMKAIKALQEAMERIESLETKVAALEGN